MNLERTDIRGLIGPVLQELTPQIHAKSLAVDMQLGPVPLIAERVETAGELQVIREMGLFGVQGQLFGEPKPWQ